MILLDTSVIVEILKAGEKSQDILKKLEVLPETDFLAWSVISYFEILNAWDPHPLEKTPFLKLAKLIPVDSAITIQASKIYKSSFNRNRRHIPDAFIAATAIVYQSPLWSLDSDFNKIHSLKLY